MGKQGSDVRGMVTSLTWGANPRKKFNQHIFMQQGGEKSGALRNFKVAFREQER